MPSGSHSNKPGKSPTKVSPETKQAQAITKIREKALDRLLPIIDTFLDRIEKGTMHLVLVGEKAPKGSSKKHSALQEVEKLCECCGQPVFKENTPIYEGWLAEPPIADIKWLVENIIGKAPTQAPMNLDSGTKFIFPAGMDCTDDKTSTPSKKPHSIGLPLEDD